jgi:hypothetical protein
MSRKTKTGRPLSRLATQLMADGVPKQAALEEAHRIYSRGYYAANRKAIRQKQNRAQAKYRTYKRDWMRRYREEQRRASAL